MSIMSKPISVGILGGGLAGATLLQGLLQHSHLKVEIYESRPAFKEQGAGICIQSNAMSALNAISPNLSARLDQAGAVVEGFKLAIGPGAQAGTQLLQSSNGSVARLTFKTVGRHAFLEQLLKDVPASCMHSSKKLVSLTEGKKVTLHFEDKTTAEHDVVIGADGINGRMRGFVVGNHPSLRPVYAGWWHMFAIAPIQETLQALGPAIIDPDNAVQWCVIGDHGESILHDYVHDKSACNLALTVKAGVAYSDDKAGGQEISVEEVLDEYKEWPEHYAKAYVNLLCKYAPKPLRCWPMLEHLPGAPFAKGNLAIMGDAAHGSGGGLAIEDALVLTTVLGRCNSVDDLPAALSAYDQLQRPRAEKVVQSSHEAGLLMSGLAPGVGLSIDKLDNGLEHKWEYIHDFEGHSHAGKAAALMDKALGRQ